MFANDFTMSDVASRFHVSEVTVLKWIKDGKLGAMVNYGCKPKYIITEDAIKRFERDYTARDTTKYRIALGHKLIDVDFESETEEAKLLRGLRMLGDILEQSPELKELILELAERS